MKNSGIKGALLFSASLLFITTVHAQDTTMVIDKTTIHERETTITQDPGAPAPTVVVAQPVAVLQPVAEKTESNSELKMGEIGLRYMPTFSALSFRTESGNVVTGSVTMNHGFGLMLGVNFTRHFGLEGDIIYYSTSQSYKDVNVNRDVTIRYIDVPLLLSFNTDRSKPINVNFVAGPQFGFNVGTHISSAGSENNDTLHAVVAVKKSDVGVAYGVGVEFALNPEHCLRLDVGYRGFYGLVDMNGTTSGNETFNVILNKSRKTQGFYVGLTFEF